MKRKSPFGSTFFSDLAMASTSERVLLVPGFPSRDTNCRRLMQVSWSTKSGQVCFKLSARTVTVVPGTVGAQVPLLYEERPGGKLVADMHLTVQMAVAGILPFCTDVRGNEATGLIGCIFSKVVSAQCVPLPPPSLRGSVYVAQFIVFLRGITAIPD